MKKKTIFASIIALLLLINSTQSVFASHSNPTKTTILHFVNSTLSEFAEKEEYEDELIDKKALKFRRYLEDMRSIEKIQAELHGKKIETSQEVLSYDVIQINSKLHLVTIRLGHHFRLDGRGDDTSNDGQMYNEATYKLLLDQSQQPFRVVGGITSTLSSGFLFPENITKEAADLDIIVENVDQEISSILPTQTELNYDLDGIIAEIRSQYRQMYKNIQIVLEIGQPSYKCNSQWINLPVSPRIVMVRTFVPLTYFKDAFEQVISWDKDTRTATLEGNGKVITFCIDKKKTFVNGTELSAPKAFIEKNHTMVPLRAISELYDHTLHYNHIARTVEITTNEQDGGQ